MSERLTDERIDRLLAVWERLPPDDEEHVANAGEQAQLLNELRERRAQDLTPFERIVLDAHRDRLAANDLEDRTLVAILDKLIAAAEARR